MTHTEIIMNLLVLYVMMLIRHHNNNVIKTDKEICISTS